MAPGIQLLFASVQKDLKCQADVAVCFVHFELIARGYSCVGQGEKLSVSPEQAERSELLPEQWNDEELYTLLYWPAGSKDTHLLKIIKIDGQLLVHFMRLHDEKVSDFTLDVDEFVEQDITLGHKALKNQDELHRRLEKELLRPMENSSSSKKSETKDKKKTEEEEPRRSRLEDDDPLRVTRPGASNYPRFSDPMDPFSVGRADLDPLARGGGGMLMDPFQRQGGGFPRPGFDPSSGLPGQRLPPGAVPPGARFDPFGPPNPDRINPGRGPRGPDPDFPTPPGYDDMFS